jgi:tRNA/rRNA methyltransferase
MDLYFILVKPAVPGNIGAAARAIKTMGYTRMRLVAPCNHLGKEARMLAHASVEILENAEIFTGLKDAIADLDITVATSAKIRDARWRHQNISDLPGIIRSKGASISKVGLVFGREESGLSNEEIHMCDMVSTIPMKQLYPSLNLGQSVMIYAYTMAATDMPESDMNSSPRDLEGFRAMMDKSKKVLKDLGIDRQPALYYMILKRLVTLGEDDVHLIHSVLNRYLK